MRAWTHIGITGAEFPNGGGIDVATKRVVAESAVKTVLGAGASSASTTAGILTRPALNSILVHLLIFIMCFRFYFWSYALCALLVHERQAETMPPEISSRRSRADLETTKSFSKAVLHCVQFACVNFSNAHDEIKSIEDRRVIRREKILVVRKGGESCLALYLQAFYDFQKIRGGGEFLRATTGNSSDGKSSYAVWIVCDFSATNGKNFNFFWSSFYCLRNFPLPGKFCFQKLHCGMLRINDEALKVFPYGTLVLKRRCQHAVASGGVPRDKNQNRRTDNQKPN